MMRIQSTTPARGDSIQGRPHRAPANSARPASSAGTGARRGRWGESLASSRDRKRLFERNTAERERVEGVVAGVAVPVERRAHRRESAGPEAAQTRLQLNDRLHELEFAGCRVCGDDRVVADEVMHGGTLRVLECLHCEHRWTQRPKARWVDLGARMNRSTARTRPRRRAFGLNQTGKGSVSFPA